VAASVVTTAAGGGLGAVLLVNQDPEWLLGAIPMDPIFSLGLLTLACSGLGWLAGPSLGSALFHLVRRGVKRPMAAKEAEFFARIRKNRVDPTTSSVQNPGEF
jgi:mitochondrial import inner membrane translocase subunit TIM23